MPILIPKYRHIKPNKPMVAGVGFSCEVRALLYDANMNLRQDTGWSNNTIFNNGLDKLWDTTANYCSIGTGTGATDEADPILQTPVGTAVTAVGNGNNVYTHAVTPNWEYAATRSKRFLAGNGIGLITEAGMGYSSTVGTNMFNRILLPVPVNKAAENVLDVIFRLTVWPDTTDHDSTAVFKGITYDTKTRIKDCDDSTPSSGQPFDGHRAWDSFKILDGGASTWTAWDGAIGPITGAPAGGKDNGGTGAGWSSETYVNGNYYRDIRYGAGLNDWVLNNNIRCLIGNLNLIYLQTQFTEATGQPNPGDPVPKDETEIMDFAWRYTWGRRP